MEDFTTETCVSSFKRLEAIFRCAICLDIVRLDVVQCVNGHLLCSECKTDLQQCPTCRGDFSPEKVTGLLAQVVEALPHRCKHKNCCEYLNTDDEDHEKYCGYKMTSCKWCGWKGPGKDIVDHIKEIHNDNIIYLEESKRRILSKDYTLPNGRIYFTPCFINNTFFWRTMSLNPKTRMFFQTFHCIPNGQPPQDMFVEVKFTSKKSNFLCKIRLNLDPDIDDEENIIHIPWKTLPDFMDETLNIPYELRFTRISDL